MDNYIENHNFGYGKTIQSHIKKLKLRNFEDLKVYIYQILKTCFNAVLFENTLIFCDDKSKEKILIEEIK